MTIEKRWSVTPKDIKRMILVCRKCGAIVGYKPQEWIYVPTKCSNCPAGEMHPASADYAHLDALRETLGKALHNENRFFEVRFEFDDREDDGEGT
jgi:hypothetical protein